MNTEESGALSYPIVNSLKTIKKLDSQQLQENKRPWNKYNPGCERPLQEKIYKQ